MTLNIPSGGIRKITKGTDQYLAIFANLGVAADVGDRDEREPRVEDGAPGGDGAHDGARRPDAEARRALRLARRRRPRPVEYSWRIDQGTVQRAWSDRARRDDRRLRCCFCQAEARAPRRGAPRRAARRRRTRRPPTCPSRSTCSRRSCGSAAGDGRRLRDQGVDIVEPREALVARVRYTDREGTSARGAPWAPLASTALDATQSAVDVEVRDEEGNVGTVQQRAHSRRPRGPSRRGRGCSNGCSTGAHSKTVVAGDRARRSVGVWASSLAGGAGRAGGSRATDRGARVGARAGLGARRARAARAVATQLQPTTECGAIATRSASWAQPGLLGAYMSVAKAADGTTAGSRATTTRSSTDDGQRALRRSRRRQKYDPGKQPVDWVDGRRASPPRPHGAARAPQRPDGWRRGETDSGATSGLWTSIAVDANGHPMVATTTRRTRR